MIPSRSEHTRYTQYWTVRSGLYRKASRILATLSYLEILLEMVSRKRLGEKKRWKVILGLESFK
jgi:peroxin-16